MACLKQIGIDVEVNSHIESHRRSFSETENDILRRILLPEQVKPTKKDSLPSPAPAERSRGLWTVQLRGKRKTAKSLKDAYRVLLLNLDTEYPDFMHRFSQETAKSRRFVARNPLDLYLKSPHLAKEHAQALVSGWYFDTNLSTEQVSSRARIAARLCNLHYGTDVQILNNLKQI